MELGIKNKIALVTGSSRGIGKSCALSLAKEEVKVVDADPHCDMPVDKDTQKFFVETIRLYTSSHCPWKCGFCSAHSFLRMSNATKEQEEKIPKIQKCTKQNQEI